MRFTIMVHNGVPKSHAISRGVPMRCPTARTVCQTLVALHHLSASCLSLSLPLSSPLPLLSFFLPLSPAIASLSLSLPLSLSLCFSSLLSSSYLLLLSAPFLSLSPPSLSLSLACFASLPLSISLCNSSTHRGCSKIMYLWGPPQESLRCPLVRDLSPLLVHLGWL